MKHKEMVQVHDALRQLNADIASAIINGLDSVEAPADPAVLSVAQTCGYTNEQPGRLRWREPSVIQVQSRFLSSAADARKAADTNIDLVAYDCLMRRIAIHGHGVTRCPSTSFLCWMLGYRVCRKTEFYHVSALSIWSNK